MPNENGSPVRFFLEEQVPLRQKIEEADIISLDMEPDVEIVEQDQLVMIKGDLVLSGHFQKQQSRSEDIEDLEAQLQLPPFQAEKEPEENQSIWSITERFPIDITVPSYKVRRLDEVYLSIEQLDYRIDEGDRLTVEVEIVLLGVENGLSGDRQEGELNGGGELASQDQGEDDGDRRKEDEIEEGQVEATETGEEQQPVRQDLQPVSTTEEPSSGHTERTEEEAEQVPIREEEREQDPPDGPIETREPEEKTREPEGETKETKETRKPEGDFRQELPAIEVKGEKKADDEVSREQEDEGRGSKVDKVSHFLGKLLAKKEETPQRTTLKICIVQPNETLAQIAERYQVSVEEIIRFNRLATEELSGGEMLYIPQKKRSLG